MTNKKMINKKFIGLFVIIGILLFLMSFFILIKGRIFVKKDSLFVLYFNEPIQNLSIGSPVMFRGVEIGKVSKIDLIVDKKNLSFSIPVYISIDFDNIFKTTNQEKLEDKQLFVERLVKEGLKGRLNTYSIITGQLMIELEILPNSKIELKHKFEDNNIVEIPTVLSSKGELTRGLQNLPIKDIIENINLLLYTINKHVPIIMDETAIFIKKINKTNNKNIDISELFSNLNDTIKNIGETAKSLHNFIDYLERHPESLLKGKNDY